MRAELRTFLEHDDAGLATRFRRALLDPDRRGEPRRSATNDDDVVFHPFAFHVGIPIVRSGAAAGTGIV